MMAGDYEKSARYYEQAHDMDIENWRYQEAAGRAEFMAGQYTKAKETLDHLSKTDKYDCPAWVWTMLGDAYLAMQRPYQARDAYQKALDLSPDDAGAWVNQAKAALTLNDGSRAVLSARRALQLEPGRVDAMLIIGCAMIQQGQDRQAVGVLDDFARACPNDAMLRCLQGRAYAGAGQTRQAGQCYALALKLDPDNALATALLSQAQATNPPVGR
jgi:tetratricopeptide (TPR) repeat protein